MQTQAPNSESPDTTFLGDLAPSEIDGEESSREVECPSTRRLVWINVWLLLICVLVMSLAFLMEREGESVVYFPFSSVAMPEVCHLKRELGVDCPGCGLTRAFLSIARFDFKSALHLNPASFFVFALVAVQIPWRITQLVRLLLGRSQLSAGWFFWYIVFCSAVLLLQWFLKLGGVSF